MTKQLLIIFILAVNTLFAQKPNAKITLVENGLTPDATVIFADSPLVRYAIIERMKLYNVPSVSIAIINNGKVEWAKAYGLADVTENRPADANTLYQAASLTKTVNAFCIMKLAQDGRLNLDTEIRSYLKTWQLPDNEFSTSKPITLRNLLSHTAGLGARGFKGYAKGEAMPTINQMLNGEAPANSDAVKPVLAPGTQVEYSGGGTLVTRKIVEDNIEKDYAALMQKTVLQPLAMYNSLFAQPLSANLTNYAAAYDATGNEFAGKYYIYPELAPDGLWATPTDYAKLIISIQQSLAGTLSVLTTASARQMVTPVIRASNAALGIFVEQRGADTFFTHTGANMGFRTGYYASYSGGKGVVVFVNSDNGQIINEIVNSVAIAYGWQGFYQPETRKLFALPNTVAVGYAGEYYSENPSVTVRIQLRNGHLALNTHAGDANFEQMYFTGANTFFLMSSPGQTAEFVNMDTLVLKDGDKVLLTLKRKK